MTNAPILAAENVRDQDQTCLSNAQNVNVDTSQMVSHVTAVQIKTVLPVLGLAKENVRLVRTVISRRKKILASLVKMRDALRALLLALENAQHAQLTIISKIIDVFLVTKEDPRVQALIAGKHA